MKKLVFIVLFLSTIPFAFGQNNVRVGEFVGGEQGEKNVFIGNNAAFKSQAAALDNVFVGQHTGYSNLSGSRNSFIGSRAGYNNLASYNNFIGYQAGFENTTGIHNNFFGVGAGAGNTTGEKNNFIGYQAGFNNQGSANNFVGNQAGYSNTTGTYNNFFGGGAGYNTTTGQHNTFIGAKAGFQNTTGDANVFIGYEAGHGETGSNKLYISNSNTSTPLIYGDFASNQLGIGTNTPAATLDVAGDISADAKVAIRNGSQKLVLKTNAANQYVQIDVGGTGGHYNDAIYLGDANTSDNKVVMMGKVGIGTKTPGYKLHVNGEAFATGNWTSSDERFKKELQKIESAMELLQGLEGLSYRFRTEDTGFEAKNFPEGKQYGFSAQQLQKAIPELVSADKDGYLAVNYSGVIPVLVEAVKEAVKEKDAEIMALKAEIESIKASLASMAHLNLQNATEETQAALAGNE